MEINNVDFLKEVLAVVLKVRNKHCCNLVKPKENDVTVCMAIILVLPSLAHTHGIPPHQNPAKYCKLAIDRVVELNHVRRHHSKDRKRPNEDRQGVLLYMTKTNAQAADDECELTDLRQVDCGKSCQALAPTSKENYKEDADPTHRHHHCSYDERLSNDFDFGCRNLHTQTNKEQGDEEVPDIFDLAVELSTVWKGGKRSSCNK